MTYNSLAEVQADISSGSITCRQLVDHYLKNINEKSHLNAFLEVYDEEARKRADEIDQKIERGEHGRLAGMIVGIKDVLCYKDHPLQAGSRILDGFKSLYNATAVQRLLAEDAIIIGRQNCDEFAMGSSNENSAFGAVLNDKDNTRVPGGSSGGSAVSVAADLCLAALGSDTGGSVRQPASFCGVIGLKPTYSRISRYGLVAYSSSFDTIGIISKSVEDAAMLLEIISGKDEFDSTVSKKEVPAYPQSLYATTRNSSVKIAYIKDAIENKGVDPEVKKATEKVISKLKNKGYSVSPVNFPYLDYMLPTYYILTTAEASSNLSRYDGIKYGYRSSNTKDIESMYKKTRSEGFGQEVKRRIMLGTFVLSADYYDAYYTKAQRVRRLIKNKTGGLFSTYDFLLLPTTATTAFKVGKYSENLIEMYLQDLFTVHASLTGLPAISIPNGTDSKGLPVGIQIIADAFKEEQLLAFAKEIITLEIEN
ncbi:MAG: Asp-tRNA(Asn)/Glu-tRNA(Gln) amidotransferase subunit GatA [Cytophagales bacterium]|nr:Asp-tRNA(Asn)/Glu-tRNA(Gln) amidotransferase subunit GatA [Cytophagales bacterium]